MTSRSIQPARLDAALNAWQVYFEAKNANMAYNLARKALATGSRHQRVSQIRLFSLLGFSCWSLKRYPEAAQWFHQGKNTYLSGYSWLLDGDLNKAYSVWMPILSARPNHWCASVLGLVNQQLSYSPSFLGVRNHTEMDVFALCQAGQMAFLESYVSYRQSLAMVNPEAYKLMGRALCYAGSTQWGLGILLEAQQHCPQDPEVYYHLAQAYCSLNNPKDAQMMLHQAIIMQPAFTPALDMLANMTA
ncbi:MAG: hypothetical protein VKK59_00005 [Vampirovibrionales bacterium]|nr:hypothetical protein [Vampirovibrionales bacterium]